MYWMLLNGNICLSIQSKDNNKSMPSIILNLDDFISSYIFLNLIKLK